MTYVTDFADQGVIVPAWLILVSGLLLAGWRRGAVAWFGAMAAVMAALLILKSAIAATGPIAGIYSPSGHTAVAALMAGGAWTVQRRLHPGKTRTRAALLTAAAAAAAIGLTRVLLGEHTIGDVLVAVPVGIAGSLLLLRLAGTPPAGARMWPSAIAVAVAMIALHGTHLSAESAIAATVGQGGKRPAGAGMPAASILAPAR